MSDEMEVINLPDNFPIELLVKILRDREDISHLSILLNREIRAKTLPAFVSREGKRPISKREILTFGKSSACTFIDCAWSNHRVYLYQCLSQSANSDLAKKIRWCECGKENGKNKILFYKSHDRLLAEGNFPNTVCLFTEYAILRKRLNCVGYDPRYADKYLIERYNREFAPYLSDEINTQDIARLFVASYIVSNLSENEEFLGVRSLDITNSTDRKAIHNQFDHCRLEIRKEVILLTGAKMTQNSYFLTL